MDFVSKGTVEKVGYIGAFVLLALAALDVLVGLKGDAARIGVLIGGAALLLLLPRLQKFSIGKDGISGEMIAEAIASAKEATEKSKQLLLQGPQSGQAAFEAEAKSGAARGAEEFNIYDFVAGLPKPTDQQDPQKGRFSSGRSFQDGWKLSAETKDFNAAEGVLSLDVTLTGPRKREANRVYFILHPSFTPSIYVATMRDGRATIFLRSWGSFTLGAVAEDGRIQLELDLAEALADAPKSWREN